jgi:hypothetical protein
MKIHSLATNGYPCGYTPGETSKLGTVLGRGPLVQFNGMDARNIHFRFFKVKSTQNPTERITDDDIRNLVNRASAFYTKSSYGKVKFTYDIYGGWLTTKVPTSPLLGVDGHPEIQLELPNVRNVFVSKDSFRSDAGISLANNIIFESRNLQISLLSSNDGFEHEIGHTLAMAHSYNNRDDQYGDSYSLMASGSVLTAPYRQFQGYLADSQVTLLESKTRTTVTIKNIDSSTATDVVAVAYKSTTAQLSTEPRGPYKAWLMNNPYIKNAIYVEYESGVVNVRAATTNNLFMSTSLLATLSNGQSYTDRTIDGITVTAHIVDASTASVDISFS